ncbi:MAG: type I-C CRISPR-associated endonuclease Cas1c [Muribaculaceae bacterium]|jgi:CRISP-associated protein Cas1|nr:type I-C CRISPR-associated endonuclease Cas1c [Muribaculaceae bacterium]
MRKLLNTLYITTPESYLKKDGENLVITVKDNEIFRIPIHNIESVVMFSYMGASPGAMKLCCDNNVGLCFLTPNGQFIARMSGPIRGNVLLRTRQFEFSNDARFSLHIARVFIAGKIQNYRNIVQRHLRDYGSNTDIELASKELAVCQRKALHCDDKETLLGIEGEAANTYFSTFHHLILQQKESFTFNGRNRRPPKDPVNSMLSFIYTLLAHDVQSALETVGLDPYVGFFHTLRPGRASLALDIMEEFRAYLGDRLVLSMINKKQINIHDFSWKNNEVLMTDKCRKEILTNWQKRKKDTILHPFLKEKIEIGLLPYVQAMLLARYLRGDLNDYPVFIIS